MAGSLETRTLKSPGDRRHLLRRLTFAAAPALPKRLEAAPLGECVGYLIESSKQAPQPQAPPVVREPWVNRALRYPETTQIQLNAMNADVARSSQIDVETLRQWWLSGMITGPAPLRENLVLFFHSTLGGSYRKIEMPHALYGHTSILRQSCFGTVPDLLEKLVLDPGMMLQEEYDESRRELPSDYSARQILKKWTVGEGNFTDDDADALARALTGWVLEAAPGQQPARQPDPRGFRANRRTGLIPALHKDLSDDGPKTILGTTRNFGARDAVRFLALHESTARRYSRLLTRYFGVQDPAGRLASRLAETYRSSEGSIDALLRTLVLSDEFWSPASRWSLIKSPVHLVVGACKQLEIGDPPVAALSSLLTVAGQTLFDAPKLGAEGWPGESTWLNPTDRLAARYELGAILTQGSLKDWPVREILERLDPAPGISAGQLPKRAAEAVKHILATPEYQVA